MLGIKGLNLLGQVFREHTDFFLIVWLFLPVIAFWLRWRTDREVYSISALTMIRTILVACTVSISFLFFGHFDQIRDRIGQDYVEGYAVEYTPGFDDVGRPVRGVSVTTDHWYSQVGVWFFGASYFAACIGLPYATWKIADHSIEVARVKQHYSSDI